jgi:glycosyltransferase involved in cell wall biosynthesis
MAAHPFFSVVVCAFNRDELLRRALDSVRRQTFEDYEVLVVDAGTSDRTRQVAEDHPVRPRYFRIPDTGIGGSRDFGLRQARGLYTAFLDDDDEYRPEHLQVRFELLRADPTLDLLYNGFRTIGSEYVPDLLNEGRFLHVDDPQIFHAGTAVVHTARAVEVGGFTTSHHKHYPDNFLEVAQAHGLKTLNVPDRTYVYHRFDTSYTGKVGKAYRDPEPKAEA